MTWPAISKPPERESVMGFEGLSFLLSARTILADKPRRNDLNSILDFE